MLAKYCYSYLNGLADLWRLRGCCLPISKLQCICFDTITNIGVKEVLLCLYLDVANVKRSR